MDSLLNTYLTMLKMSENDPRYESMLFNYETTAKDEFRNGAIRESKKTVFQEAPRCLRAPPPPLKHAETLAEWRSPGVPVELLLKPKEVVRTNPHKIQEPYTDLEDLDRERVRATRPRLLMPPAVSMDDIEDVSQRELLTREMYTTSTQMALKLGIASARDHFKNVKAPLPGVLASTNTVALPRWRVPYVSPEWRMQCARWDARQRRAHCDPCARFYLARPLRCKVCEETAAREMKRKMLRRHQ